LLERSAGWAGEAWRWGGASAPPRLAAVFGAAASHPRDLAGAREAAGEGDADLAGALTGMAVGAPAADAAPKVLEALERLAKGARS